MVIISLSVQLGDLFFSYLKRKSSLKNTGNILPGHGGILDRIDGILLGIPLGFYFIRFNFSIYRMKKKLSIFGCTGSIGDTVFKT